MKIGRSVWCGIGIGGCIVLWQIVVMFSGISPRLLPDPLSVLDALVRNWELVFVNALTTLFEALLGLCISIVLGVLLAIGIDASERIKHVFSPILVLSQTIPIIALAPLLLVWFGFGTSPKVIIVVLYCFFPITLAMGEGLGSLNKNILFLLKSMHATRAQILLKAKLPASMPFFMAGLSISVVYAIAAAIVGEFVGGYRGLGIVMLQAANSHRIDLLFALIIFSSCMSFVLYLLVILLRKKIIPWEYQQI